MPAGQTGTVCPPVVTQLPFASTLTPGGQNCPAVVPPLDVVQVPLALTVAPAGHIMAGRVALPVVQVPFAPGVVPAGQKRPFVTVPAGGGAQVALVVPAGQAIPGVSGVHVMPTGQSWPAGGRANVPLATGAMPCDPAAEAAFVMPVLIAASAESLTPIVLPFVENAVGGSIVFTILFPDPAAA